MALDNEGPPSIKMPASKAAGKKQNRYMTQVSLDLLPGLNMAIMMAGFSLILGLSGVLVMATETVTVSTTVTECAASCYPTSYGTTNVAAYSPVLPGSSATQVYPDLPSSGITDTYTSSQEQCTDQPSCSHPVPTPPPYTTPEWPVSSEAPVTTGYGPSTQDSDASSTKESCWSSGEESISTQSSSTWQSYSRKTPPAYDVTTTTPLDNNNNNNNNSPSHTIYSTETQPATDSVEYPTPSLTGTSASYSYPLSYYESSVDATWSSQQSAAATTFVTNTRQQRSSESPDSTKGLPPPPPYETATGEPPSYGGWPSHLH
ncbi:hypothetical protein ED733_008013 [Metarhizium rileyi]|uniref:Uncharacterized protein n=1 Tax=Metarhizium rileyi (strain RCEF 4871) TaxID=1649241 RepID=A0A5C6GJV6_METRR|nr:hypothetical protein ED733_008013 [Metarhizium rileyi]